MVSLAIVLGIGAHDGETSSLDRMTVSWRLTFLAGVAKQADAPGSKSGGGNSVRVRLPPPALPLR